MKLGKLVCISTLAVTGFADRVNSGNEIKNGYKVSVQFPVHLRSTSGHLSLDIFQKNKQEKQKDKKARLLRRLRKEAPVRLDDGVVIWNEGIGNIRLTTSGFDEQLRVIINRL